MVQGSLKEGVKERVVKKANQSGKKRATIIEVAKEAGVSPATVSNALNSKGYVDVQTHERIKEAISKLGYIPNIRARQLRSGKTNMIGIFSSMPLGVASGPSRLGFMMEISESAAAAALTRGMALVLTPPGTEAISLLNNLQIDGALLIEPSKDDPFLSALKERGIPTVAVGHPINNSDIASVDTRTNKATALVLEHFYKQGAKQIALMIATTERSSYQDALTTYQQCCETWNMTPKVVRAEECDGEAAGYLSTLELMKKSPQVDAIYASVDAFAVGARKALDELGLRIPEDVMLATRYDGFRARQCNPPLTAVNLQLDQIARHAVSLLLRQLNIAPSDGKESAVISDFPELIERTSSRRIRKLESE